MISATYENKVRKRRILDAEHDYQVRRVTTGRQMLLAPREPVRISKPTVHIPGSEDDSCEMTSIASITDGQRNVNVVGTIARKFPAREVSLKTGETASVVDAILKDASGEIKLSLWNEQGEIAEGSRVEISNGYVSGSYKGRLQLAVGRFGTLKVLA